VPAFAAEHDARLRKTNCGPYEVATSAPRVVENFLDMAHFGFVHEGWLGDRAHLAVDDYRVDATADGFLATGCKPGSRAPACTPRRRAGRVQLRSQRTYTAVLCKVPDARSVAIDGFRESIALFVCPVGPEASRSGSASR
jgi:phenylpropionate dioxygenase-like ring-hydroxylating dioxygenase large terminal subunit